MQIMTIVKGITLLAALGHAVGSAHGAGPKENAASIDQWLTDQVAEGFAGQVLLERDGQVVLDKAYGLADESVSRKADADSLYYIGSLSKMFTSAVVLQLVEEKKLSLSGKIGSYLEGVPKDKARITIRHLLTHTSGAVSNHADPLSKLDKDAFVEWFMQTPLDHKPGSKHQYSNAGFSLLAAIVEQVEGATFQESMRRYVFEPAGMSSTFFLDEMEPHINRVVVGTGPEVTKYNVDGKPASYGGTWLRIGPGGIVSTAGDLLKWELAIRNGSVLSKSQYRRATRPYKPHEPWGMGWRLSRTTRKTPLHYHDGGFPGFSALFARYPKENAVIILLSNRDGAAGQKGKRISKEFFSGE